MSAGSTPLYLAAWRNQNPDVIKALLAAGADPMSRGGFLIKGTPLHAAARNENLDVIKALLATGSDPMARDETGETPLHVAAGNNKNPAVIALLVEAGARLEARAILGRTPLHEAADSEGTGAVVLALLAVGANTEARDEYGNTPLHKAANCCFSFSSDDVRHAGDAIEALLDGGADPTARNAAGKTPWDFAQENKALKGSDAYWRLNEARFNAPQGVTRHTTRTGPEPRHASGAPQPPLQVPGCEIPGYPSPPGGLAGVGLAWCPASVDFQVRAFALQVAGIQCSLAEVPDPSPEVVSQARNQINEVCNRLGALGPRLGVSNCRCPAGYGP